MYDAMHVQIYRTVVHLYTRDTKVYAPRRGDTMN